MTAPTTAPPAAPTPTPTPAGSAVRSGPDARSVRRRGRVGAGILLLVLAVGVVTALATGSRGGLLDPRSARPEGTRALAVLLGDRGVRVRAVTGVPAAGGPRTVVAAFPDRLTRPELARLAGEAAAGADLVLVAPGGDTLAALPGGLRRTGSADGGVAAPACDLPAATAAGSAYVEGPTYTGPGVTACYPRDGDAALLVRPYGRGRIVVLGSRATLTNQRLDQQGDAALAIDLLGRHPDLSWLLTPSGRPSAVAARSGLLDLLPDRVVLALVQLLVAIVVLGLWRARRLGRPVREPLPVVVRGAETVEGRARLYEAARARGHAAGALRAGARDRLVETVGHVGDRDGDDGAAALVASVADRTGRSPGEVAALLYGSRAAGPPGGVPTGGVPTGGVPTGGVPTGGVPTGGVPTVGGEPTDDAALIRLADDLDILDRQVRHP